LLQTSTDAGETWTDRDLSRYEVRQILALSVRDANYGTAVVKLGDGCAIAGFRSYTGGQFWERAEEVLAEFTYLDPDDSSVAVNGERADTPCADIADVAMSGEGPAALCGDGSIYVWSEAGWFAEPKQMSAVAVVSGAGTLEFVLVGADECSLTIGAAPDGADPTVRLCAPTDAVPARTVAVLAESGTWVWSPNWFGAL